MPAQPAPNPATPALFLLGGGGHAIVVAEAACLAGVPLGGFLDDHPAAPLAAILIDLPHPFPAPPHLGPLGSLHRLTGGRWIVALGELRHRRGVLKTLASDHELAHHAGSVVHPSAIVSPSAQIAPGVFIGPGAIVHSRARIAPHAIINSGAIIEHDCVIGENAHVAPGAALAGGVHVGHDTLIGIGARVLPMVHVGSHCTVGGGAVVVRNLPDHTTAMGSPARARKPHGH